MIKTIFLVIFTGFFLAGNNRQDISTGEWLPDSSLVAYYRKPENAWVIRNPITNTSVTQTNSPFIPELTDAEKLLYQTNGFMRSSADSELLVYPNPEQLLTIANRTTQEIFVTDIEYTADVFPVWWSEDGQGFGIHGNNSSAYAFDPIFYYVRIVDRNDLSHSIISFIRNSNPLEVNNRVFSPIESEVILDVSEHRVLTTMSELTNFGNANFSAFETQSYLVIWDTEQPEDSLILNGFNGRNIIRASFAPDNTEQIMVIIEDSYESQPGLYLYDIPTNSLQYLASLEEYSSSWLSFSPNGEWLSVVMTGVGGVFLRTRDLIGAPVGIATAFPTLTPYPTFTPTPTNTPIPSQ